MFARFRSDIQCILDRDPAARTRWEVMTCYPGLHAIWFHRVAHALWRRGFRWAGRWLSHWGRFLTGIEIHPGAKIGDRVFIDHGMGVVIGETAEVGDGCTIYQGVTLGGTSLEKGSKRHPTLGRDVVVGASAKVLGSFTVGDGAKIGSSAVVTKPVPQGATAVGNPARVIVPDAGSPAEAQAQDKAAPQFLKPVQPVKPEAEPAVRSAATPQARLAEAPPTVPVSSAATGATVGVGSTGLAAADSAALAMPVAGTRAAGAAVAPVHARALLGAAASEAEASRANALTHDAAATKSATKSAAQPDAGEGGFVAYGVTAGDDPVAQAMRAMIEGTASQAHQIALLWQAVETLSERMQADCLPQDAARQAGFDAEGLKKLIQ